MIAVNARWLADPFPTGIGRVATQLTLAARQAGLPMRVIAPSTATSRPFVDRVSWAPKGTYGTHFWEQFLLPRQTRSDLLLSLCNTAPLLNRRNVVFIYDFGASRRVYASSSAIRAYGWIVERAARAAHFVLVSSQAIEQEALDRGVSADRIGVVPLAVDSHVKPKSPSEVANVERRLGLRPPYFLMLGWSNPRKNVATVLEAHKTVCESINHQLVLVGPNTPGLAPPALAASETVMRFPWLEDDDAVAVLTGATALLYPSTYEGFGIPPLEAMACGTPAIVSDIPVLRESTGGRATFIPPTDVAGWAEAMEGALRGAMRSPEPPTYTWQDAGKELVRLLGVATSLASGDGGVRSATHR